uniref:V-type proton ATPase subunit C n=1 Tax=Cyanistes caeruleus TaxID=156563 RepID=A0A8C0U551_CYACU
GARGNSGTQEPRQRSAQASRHGVGVGLEPAAPAHPAVTAPLRHSASSRPSCPALRRRQLTAGHVTHRRVSGGGGAGDGAVTHLAFILRINKHQDKGTKMTEFWLISAPGEKTCQQTWEKLHAATTKHNNLSTNSKFNIPDLKVGTLDVLVGLSDELAKLDAFVESVVKKVAQYMADVLEDSKDKVQENLLANGG